MAKKENKKENKKELSEYLSEIYTPNKFIQPLNYLTFKMMNKISQFSEKDQLKEEIKPFKEFFNRFSQSWGGILGLLIFASLFLLAFIVPFFTQDPTILNPDKKLLPFFSDGFFLGTNINGQDLWAQLWHGLRFSLLIAIAASFIDILIGVTFGILMGYFDMFDRILQFIIKIISNVPTIIIMILATIVFSPSFFTIVGALIISGWIGAANQVRAQVKRARNFEWVLASRVLGTPKRKIIVNFIPVIIPILITQLVFSIPGAVLVETSLSFIGLSLPNTPTLGNSITEGAKIITLHSRYVLVPSTLLILLTSSIQLFGNATQDALRRQR